MFTQIEPPTRLQFLPPPLPPASLLRRRPNFSGHQRSYLSFPGRRVFNCLNATAYDKNSNPSQESEEFTGSVEEEVRRAYPFHEIEPKWQRYWEDNKTFRTPDDIDTSKPKFYVLDMFPYPSGAGLHVGHPLGYTATDILARLKRMQGFNVLHPMGWDAFGLPAEQYAIETGTHPKITTLKNIDRFRSQVLYDVGIVSTKEPFQCVINQGIILGEVQYIALRDSDGNLVSADSVDEMGSFSQESVPEDKVIKSGDSFVLKDNPNVRLIARAHKMSKSRGNVVNPDDVVSQYGADSLRLYEMFMGPFRDSKTWSTSGIDGVHRFLARVWRLVVGSPSVDGKFKDGTVGLDGEPSLEQLRCLHRCINKVTEEIEGTRFNTGISAMMEFTNAAYKWDKLPRSIIEEFVLLLSPYAPHMAEELWSRLGHSSSLAYEPFPKVNPAYLKESTVVLPVQINGKTRGTIQVEKTCTEEDAFKLASLDSKLSKFLVGKSIKKRIFVPGKILNIILDAQSAKVGQP
ncbi:UNVERIFIED_CONTAM: Leucine--tRNA ligase, chloroplastic/mitochondrial [Sesamum angustifolium]|uniref:leucine--tRNA ligase n=1 Tax=Sesamum angustifolium TaxID=2727405 RepID=A0AAW2PCC2_9LAMI